MEFQQVVGIKFSPIIYPELNDPLDSLEALLIQLGQRDWEIWKVGPPSTIQARIEIDPDGAAAFDLFRLCAQVHALGGYAGIAADQAKAVCDDLLSQGLRSLRDEAAMLWLLNGGLEEAEDKFARGLETMTAVVRKHRCIRQSRLMGGLFSQIARAVMMLRGIKPSAHHATSRSRNRMTVDEANSRAMEIAKMEKRTFFNLSITAQADKIGCHLRTWKQTPFYKQNQSRLQSQTRPRATGSPKAASLTSASEAVHGRGDEELNYLIGDSQADSAGEPSPLDDARTRPVRCRKRV